MELIASITDWLLHLDDELKSLVESYGLWVYLILFVIVFCETGLVVTPFLPGDSLLFVAGALAGDGRLNVIALIAVLLVAAIVGDSVNYQIGNFVGPRVFREDRQRRWLKREYLERTQEFFEKYGGKTIVIARFLPIIRTFAPFVAGVGSMRYPRFLAFNIAGGVVWVVSIVMLGYWFGGLDVVSNNFELVIIGIIVLSVIPPAFEFLRSRRRRSRTTENA